MRDERAIDQGGVRLHGLAGLRELIGEAPWRRWALAAFLSRLPTTMTLIALMLVGEHVTGSLATGAQLAGVATLMAGVASPWRGRMLDRRELRKGLQQAALMSAAVIVAQATAVAVSAPLPVLFGLALFQGAAMAAIMGGFRALLVPTVGPSLLPRANAFDAIFIEVAFVGGPAMAALVAWVVGPVGVLLVMASAFTCSAWLLGRLPAVPPSPRTDSGPAPWRSPAVLPIYGLALGLGVTIGLMESAVPARVTELGSSAEFGGSLLMLIAVGGVVGGLGATMLRDARGTPWRRGAVLMFAMSVLLVPIATAGAVPVLVFALLLCGLPIAPLNALAALVLQDAVSPGRRAEAFAVLSASIMLGAGAGQSVTGFVLDVSTTVAQAVGLGASQIALIAAACVPLALSVGLFTVGSTRSRRLPPDLQELHTTA